MKRKRQLLEAEELEYAERLAKARHKEAVMRRAAKARVRKKLVFTWNSTIIQKSHSGVQQKPNAAPLGGEVVVDDDMFLPDNLDGLANEDDNVSPAVRALMQK